MSGDQSGHGHRRRVRDPEAWDRDVKEWRLPRHSPPVEAQRQFVRDVASKHADGTWLLAMLLGDDHIETPGPPPVVELPARPRRRRAAGGTRRLRADETSLGKAA